MLRTPSGAGQSKIFVVGVVSFGYVCGIRSLPGCFYAPYRVPKVDFCFFWRRTILQQITSLVSVYCELVRMCDSIS